MGRLYVGMHQISSPLVDKSGLQVGETKSWRLMLINNNNLQPQYVIYLANPRSEASSFPRYYINPASYNYIVVSQRHIKMLRMSGNCFDSDETRSRSACYVRTWLYRKLVEK